MKRYGIIGHPVAHSFSARYFADKFAREHIDAEYKLYDLPTLSAEALPALDGYNVTIPYKESIIPMLDCIDPVAQEIGAVNVVRCVRNEKGYHTVGYNTDYIGFTRSLQTQLRATDTQALIFGTGGASKAVAYALAQLHISFTFVSRHPHETNQVSYNQLTPEIIRTHTLLINCTPVGMWPDVEECLPIPYEAIGTEHFLFDCVYNPEETLFLSRGRTRGARTCNGYEMLVIQAEEAWKIWKLEN